jgi:hypothetical protein
LIERKETSTSFPYFLSRCACSLPFYQDVLGTFLSIKICLFPSFLSRCACFLPFYQDVIVPFLSINARCACYLPFYQKGNKHILIERKVTSTSGYKEREQAYLDRKEWNKHIKIERKGTSTS